MNSPTFHKVDIDDDGIRLDRWFKRHFPDITHVLIQKLLRKGAIKLDGKKVKPDTHIKTDQEIRIPYIEKRKSVEKSKSLATIEDAEKYLLGNILYKDNDIIVLNKPHGLPVQGGSKVKISVDDMLDFLRFDATSRPKLTHRIDKDTSGILLIARTSTAATKLTLAFKNKEIKKTYWAAVKGHIKPSSGKIDLPLSIIGDNGKAEKTTVDKENGKKAVTFYKAVEFAGQQLSWIAIMPISGRKHQIRAHMSAIGYPVLGDGKYGGKEAFINGAIGKNLHLHARSVEFNVFGRQMSISAPLTSHMMRTWKTFGFDEKFDADIFDNI